MVYLKQHNKIPRLPGKPPEKKQLIIYIVAQSDFKDGLGCWIIIVYVILGQSLNLCKTWIQNYILCIPFFNVIKVKTWKFKRVNFTNFINIVNLFMPEQRIINFVETKTEYLNQSLCFTCIHGKNIYIMLFLNLWAKIPQITISGYKQQKWTRWCLQEQQLRLWE